MTTAFAGMVRVQWTCRNRTLERLRGITVATSCGREFTADASRAEFNAGTARARCPRCSAMVTQGSDGCEVAT